MIPGPGDIVDINPLFKKIYRDHISANARFGEDVDGYIHVTSVKETAGGYFIGISTGGGYAIDKCGAPSGFVIKYGFPKDARLFIFVRITTSVFNKTDLKIKNTRSEATHCANCGAELRDPGMGPIYKHCLKCEP